MYMANGQGGARTLQLAPSFLLSHTYAHVAHPSLGHSKTLLGTSVTLFNTIVTLHICFSTLLTSRALYYLQTVRSTRKGLCNPTALVYCDPPLQNEPCTYFLFSAVALGHNNHLPLQSYPLPEGMRWPRGCQGRFRAGGVAGQPGSASIII